MRLVRGVQRDTSPWILRHVCCACTSVFAWVLISTLFDCGDWHTTRLTPLPTLNPKTLIYFILFFFLFIFASHLVGGVHLPVHEI